MFLLVHKSAFLSSPVFKPRLRLGQKTQTRTLFGLDTQNPLKLFYADYNYYATKKSWMTLTPRYFF
jgi:hypothetical protein